MFSSRVYWPADQHAAHNSARQSSYRAQSGIERPLPDWLHCNRPSDTPPADIRVLWSLTIVLGRGPGCHQVVAHRTLFATIGTGELEYCPGIPTTS